MNVTDQKLQVLLVEDEIKIAEFVIDGLGKKNMAVHHCENGEAGLRAFLDSSYDVVLLDVMLPKLSGFEVLQQIRQHNTDVSVIMLTARSELPDRLQGFELGADDYLSKPFYVEELIARIQALQHRKSPDSDSRLAYQSLSLDVTARTAHWGELTAVLSQREFSLMAYLMRSPGHIYSRQQILKHVWGLDFDPETNVVDVCVGRIKRKLTRGPNKHDSPIESVRGVGYRLKTEALS